MKLELNLSELSDLLKNRGKRILIQLPEGLKTRVTEIQSALPKHELFFSIDPVFGACDIQEHLAKRVNADLILHFGHTKFIDSSNKVIYWPTFYSCPKAELLSVIKNIEKHFANRKITIVYPIQYEKVVETIKSVLKENKVVELIECKTNKRIQSKGQILGCDISTAIPILDKVDSVLYFGDGFFHPEAFYEFKKELKLYRVFPPNELEQIILPDKKRNLMLPHIIKDKKTFGIFVSHKLGQAFPDVAVGLKQLLEQNNKTVYLLVGDTLNNSNILGFELDVLINTACPRIADDYKNYKPIVVNPNVIFEAFKK